MKSYRITGTYEMTYIIDVDEEVDADSELEAINTVQEMQVPGKGHDQYCRWCLSGPDVGVIE